jgi:hypothetical protein
MQQPHSRKMTAVVIKPEATSLSAETIHNSYHRAEREIRKGR